MMKPNVGENVKKLNISHVYGTTTLKNSTTVPLKTKHATIIGPSKCTSRIDAMEIKTYIPTKTCTSTLWQT